MLVCSPRLDEHSFNELGLAQRVALARLQRVAVMGGGELQLELQVLLANHRVTAKDVAKRDVPGLLLAPRFADVHMMGTRPLGRFDEVGGHHVELAEHDVRIPQVLERRRVRGERDQRRDRYLDVDDRLCRKTRDGCGSHMLDAQRQCAELRAKRLCLSLEELRPRRLVRGNVEHRPAGSDVSCSEGLGLTIELRHERDVCGTHIEAHLR